MTHSEKINLTSLNLVQNELVATIEQSALHLEEFSRDRHNADLLQNCIDGIKQISGTLSLIQLRGVDMLAQELLEHITDIPLGDEPGTDRRLEALTSAFFILPRYLEYCLQTSRSLAVLLIPHINQLRQLRKVPPLPESYFYPLEVCFPVLGPAPDDLSLGEDLTKVGRRLRHMYQTGLVKVLQGKPQRSALGMMGRALERLKTLSEGRPLGQLWWSSAAVIEALSDQDLQLSASRKRLLSALDREIKKVQLEGAVALEQQPNLDLVKELLYLIALSRSKAARAQKIAQTYQLEPLPYTDQELSKELEFLTGPSSATISSMGAVLKDELRSSKNILERAAQGGTELLNESPELLVTLKKVADILSVVGLVSASNGLRQEVHKITEWRDSGASISPEELLAVADTLLYIESSVSGLGKTSLSDERLAQINASSRDEIVASTQLAEAEQLVFEEAEAGLAMVKRALSSFAESNYDVGHIKNVSTSLTTVRGGMTLLNLNRAAKLLAACVRFIEVSLLQNQQPAAVQHMLETFADAIISLEYYLESVRYERKFDDGVLQVAEESLEALGYPVN